MRRKSNEIPKLHVKKGDTVKVLSGDDRGAVGKILKIFPAKRKALVENVNFITKHVKPNSTYPNGERLRTEAPLWVDKLQLIDPKTNKPTRIGREKTDKGWVRVTKKSNTKLD